MVSNTIKRPTPNSQIQASQLYSNDKIKSLTKLKIKEYIDTFFNKANENYNLLKVISPRSITYNTDRSFSADLDPTQRALQIARYTTELRAVLPAIVIADGAISTITSLGSIDEYRQQGDFTQSFFPVFKKLSISVLAAAKELTEADELASLQSLMFNELRNIAGGSRITGREDMGERWCITLPHGGVEVGALNSIDVPDDPIEKIWYCEYTLDVFYEDTIAIQQTVNTFDYKGLKVNDSFEQAKVIQAPDMILIGERVQAFVVDQQVDHRLILEDSDIATIDNNMIITPRRKGTTRLLLVTTKDMYGPNRTVLAEKTVTIK